MKKYIALVSTLLVLSLVIVGVSIHKAQAVISLDQSTLSVQYRVVDFFASTTGQSNFSTSTNATSTNITPYFDSSGRYDNGAAYIPGAKKVTLYFGRLNGVTGTSTYRVQVSPDGTNWYDYNKLIQNIVSSNLTLINISTSTISNSLATSTTIVSMDLSVDNFDAIRCIATVAGDGLNTCRAAIAY